MWDWFVSLTLGSKICLMSLFFQCVSTFLIVCAFVFDIRIRRNVAKQAIIHDWYKAIIISDLKDTFFVYFDAVVDNYSCYQNNLISTTDIVQIKEINVNAVAYFQGISASTISRLVNNLAIINPKSAAVIDGLFEKFQDDAISIMERTPIKPDEIMKNRFEILVNGFRSAAMKELFQHSQDSVSNISR